MWVRGYLQKKGVNNNCITKAPASMGDSSQSTDLEHTAQPVLAQKVGERPLMCLNWSKPLPGNSAGFCFFQEAGLDSESCLQLGSS